jgi:hypothetical protein
LRANPTMQATFTLPVLSSSGWFDVPLV